MPNSKKDLLKKEASAEGKVTRKPKLVKKAPTSSNISSASDKKEKKQQKLTPAIKVKKVAKPILHENTKKKNDHVAHERAKISTPVEMVASKHELATHASHPNALESKHAAHEGAKPKKDNTTHVETKANQEMASAPLKVEHATHASHSSSSESKPAKKKASLSSILRASKTSKVDDNLQAASGTTVLASVAPRKHKYQESALYKRLAPIFLTYKARRISIILVIFIILISLISVGLVALFKTPPNINFVTATSSSFSTSNYTKEQSGRTVYSSTVEGLITPSPNGVEPDKSDSLTTILSVKKLSVMSSQLDKTSFDGFLANSPAYYGYSDIEVLTYGMADYMTFSYVPKPDPLSGIDQSQLSTDEIDEIVANSAEIGNVWKFHIRSDARWQNGDRVSAQDFVQTIKYAADLRNGSTLIRDFRDVSPIRGLGALIKEQQDYYKTYKQYRPRLEEYSSYGAVFDVGGGVWARGNPAEPESSFLPYEGASQSVNSYLYYQFEPGYNAPDLIYKLGRPLFLPINKRFVDKIGGIDKFGLSADTLLSNGPFYVASYDPDYEVIFEKSNTYWDRDRTLVDRWAMRVLPDISTQIQLFKSGALTEVSIPNEYLKVFQESENLKKLLIKGGSSRATRYFKWNLGSDKTLGIESTHPEIANNVHLRRAFSLALGRKSIIDTISAGDTTPAGDTFTPFLSQFTDRNGNTFDDYLYRASYKLNGIDLGSMKQFQPREAQGFDQATYISDIKKDSYTNLEAARKELEVFLTQMPEYRNTPIPVDVIFSTTDRFLTLRMQQNLDEAFAGRILINAKPLPDSVFNNRIRENKGFDLAYVLTEPDSQEDAWTMLRFLAAPVQTGEQSGITTNVTWGWTYADGLKWLTANEPGRIYSDLALVSSEQELRDFTAILEEMRKSSLPRTDRAATPATFVKENEFFRSKVRTVADKMNFYVKLEKLIRDQAPIATVYHSPSGWYARQIIGATSIAGWDVQYKYAYNANKVPVTPYSLPGLEIYN